MYLFKCINFWGKHKASCLLKENFNIFKSGFIHLDVWMRLETSESWSLEFTERDCQQDFICKVIDYTFSWVPKSMMRQQLQQSSPLMLTAKTTTETPATLYDGHVVQNTGINNLQLHKSKCRLLNTVYDCGAYSLRCCFMSLLPLPEPLCLSEPMYNILQQLLYFLSSNWSLSCSVPVQPRSQGGSWAWFCFLFIRPWNEMRLHAALFKYNFFQPPYLGFLIYRYRLWKLFCVSQKVMNGFQINF